MNKIDLYNALVSYGTSQYIIQMSDVTDYGIDLETAELEFYSIEEADRLDHEHDMREIATWDMVVDNDEKCLLVTYELA